MILDVLVEGIVTMVIDKLMRTYKLHWETMLYNKWTSLNIWDQLHKHCEVDNDVNNRIQASSFK